MYIKTEVTDSWFERDSTKGRKHRYKRSKTIYHLSCDCCKLQFTRYKGDMDPKRFAKKYSHFCDKCKGQASIKGQESRRKNLDKKIGERIIDSMGYVAIYVGKDYPYSKEYGGRIREHIFVMENHLNRALRHYDRKSAESEVVHHIDGNRQNNTLSNLQLMTVKEHNSCHGAAGNLIFDLYKQGVVKYNKRTKMYYM